VQSSGTSNALNDFSFVDTRNGWVIGYESTILHTTDAGYSWKKQVISPNDPRMNLDAIGFTDKSTGTIIGEGGYIYRTTNGGVTFVEQGAAEAPQEFTLSPNHPNPFSAGTTIGYSIPERARITITVHDALGRELARLFDGERLPGEYAASFSDAHLPTGVYFCRMQAGGRMVTRKMMVLR
jgi:hypothetical protein